MILMVQAIVDIRDDTNQVLNIVKAKYNLKDKNQAIDRVVKEYAQGLLEPQLRPEYVMKINRLQTEKAIPFKDMVHLRKLIE